MNFLLNDVSELSVEDIREQIMEGHECPEPESYKRLLKLHYYTEDIEWEMKKLKEYVKKLEYRLEEK